MCQTPRCPRWTVYTLCATVKCTDWTVLSPISSICDQSVVLAQPPIPLGIWDGWCHQHWNKFSKNESARKHLDNLEVLNWYYCGVITHQKTTGIVKQWTYAVKFPCSTLFSNIRWCFEGWFLRVRPVFRRHRQLPKMTGANHRVHLLHKLHTAYNHIVSPVLDGQTTKNAQIGVKIKSGRDPPGGAAALLRLRWIKLSGTSEPPAISLSSSSTSSPPSPPSSLPIFSDHQTFAYVEQRSTQNC